MPEPIVTVGVGAIAAYLGKDGLQKLLGPTADYLGGGLRDLAQRRIENIGRIFRSAEKKLGDKMDKPGEVPPRVLKAILDDGSFCDDALAAEYFGGVLASSRNEGGRDDRGARMAKMLDGMSVYQIRTHYLIYSSIRQLFSGSLASIQLDGRRKMKTFFPLNGYAQAMEITGSEIAQFEQIVSHVFFGLHADNLIEDAWQYGPQDSIAKLYPAATEAGIVFQPSALGAELFLWAFGQSDQPLNFILNGRFDSAVEGVPAQVQGAAPLTSPEAT